MVEYAIPAVTILIALGVVLINGPFFQNFQEALSRTNNGDLTDKKLEIGHSGIVSQSSIQNAQELKQYYLIEGISFVQGNTACFADTGCLNFPDVSNLAVAEVDGSLGETTVKEYARLLRQLAQNLKEKGAPEGLVSRVEDLGRMGMNLGNSLNRIDPSFHPCYPDCSAYTNDNSPYKQAMAQKTAYQTEFSQLKTNLDWYLQNNAAANEAFASASPIVKIASKNILEASSGGNTTQSNVGMGYQSNGRLVKSNATIICQTVNENSSCPTIP